MKSKSLTFTCTAFLPAPTLLKAVGLLIFLNKRFTDICMFVVGVDGKSRQRGFGARSAEKIEIEDFEIL